MSDAMFRRACHAALALAVTLLGFELAWWYLFGASVLTFSVTMASLALGLGVGLAGRRRVRRRNRGWRP
jgi:uncharacterized membrane protein YadS